MRSGSCSVWCTTSRNWRGTGRCSNTEEAEGGFGRRRELALKASKKTDEEPNEQNKNGAEKTAPFLRPQRLEKGFFYSLNVEITRAARLYRAASG
jgi:hypothetical protein